jgi:hypothetical protein
MRKMDAYYSTLYILCKTNNNKNIYHSLAFGDFQLLSSHSLLNIKSGLGM